jgi:gamma-glutamylcyclotransferase (GGCT)/AIG2-like uncharacterized protein YtfP
MKKISVYGSLLEGLGNHRLLHSAKKIAEDIIEVPYKMIGYGYSFPALIPSEEVHKVFFETYEVDDETYSRVEMLEGFPSFYNRTNIETSVGSSEFYFIDDKNEEGNTVIKTADVYNWRKHINRDAEIN